jgi:hypothetical protein
MSPDYDTNGRIFHANEKEQFSIQLHLSAVLAKVFQMPGFKVAPFTRRNLFSAT